MALFWGAMASALWGAPYSSGREAVGGWADFRLVVQQQVEMFGDSAFPNHG
jgi:hypothetical protein